MYGWMWLLQKPQSTTTTWNISLYLGNFEISLLKGIFYLFLAGAGGLRNQLLRDFQNTFCQVFVFCLMKDLLLFMSSRKACHILPHQLVGERLFVMSVNLDEAVFSSWCFLPVCFQETPLWRICGSVEASWIPNEDANLNSNSKLKILLNNEWISTSALILILHVCVLYLCIFEMQCSYLTSGLLSLLPRHFFVVIFNTNCKVSGSPSLALMLKGLHLHLLYWYIDIHLYLYVLIKAFVCLYSFRWDAFIFRHKASH